MLKIWGRDTSINVQKVLWCAEELGLAYQRVDVGGEYGGNDQPEYLAMNPNGLVPTIEEGGLVLWESNSIVRYLAAKHGAGSLSPADPGERGRADRWMDWQLTTLSNDMRTVFWGLVRTPPEKRDMGAIDAAAKSLSGLWARLDRSLGESAFVAGDRFTMGDIPVGCFAYRWLNLPIDRARLANVEAWYGRLAQRPGYKKHVMVTMR
jgi:glutathione S-transferase